jgi:hypothetical protein
MFKDNARAMEGREHGTEPSPRMVQGIARDILVAAIARMEARGLSVVLHVTTTWWSAPIGTVTPPNSNGSHWSRALGGDYH